MSTPENGGHVTRAELRAHLDPMRENIREIKDDVAAGRRETNESLEEIRKAVGAGPRWLGARANAIVDKVLPALLALAAFWMLGERLS